MSKNAIVVKDLGKRYRLGHRDPIYKTFRDSLAQRVSATFKNDKPSDVDFLWALKNVSFEIEKGQAFGVIGANGSGKSTLLKILSRITEPTEGRAEIYGRVGSLLEVGTGFHPELTGRENTYLNGAILGMRKKEIDAKFDEIVAFAEVEKFIDTAVKHYSSGMQVRLAFSVAAHLPTEILLVDEALSVGDASFQKKCLGKLGEVVGQEKTVLFVSHNMGAIKSLTNHAIWLSHGQVKEVGDPSTVVEHYLSSFISEDLSGSYGPDYLQERRVNVQKFARNIVLKSLSTQKIDGTVTGRFLPGDDIFVEFELQSKINSEVLEVMFRVKTTEGQLIFTCFPGIRRKKISSGSFRSVIKFSPTSLLPGMYYAEVIVLTQMLQDKVSPAFYFEIISPTTEGADTFVMGYTSSAVSELSHSLLGIVHVASSWEDFSKTGDN